MRTLEEVTDAQLRKHQPMVRQMVLKLIAKLPANVEKDDLMQVGMIALADGLTRFDTEKTSQDAVDAKDLELAFVRFAGARVKGAMIDHLREMDHVSRSQRQLVRRIAAARSQMEHACVRVTDKALAEQLGVSEREIRECEVIPIKVDVAGSGTVEDDVFNSIPARSAFGAIDLTEDSLIRKQEVHILLQAMSELPERMRQVIQMYHFDDFNLKEIGAHFSTTEDAACRCLKLAVEKLSLRVRKLENVPHAKDSYALAMTLPLAPITVKSDTRWA